MKTEDITGGKGEKEYSDLTFHGLDLKSKTITARRFYSCVFRNCDLTGAALESCRFADCRFESCNLSLVKVQGSSFSETSFKDSKLTGVNWTEAAWPRVRLPGPISFESCVLSDCNFFGLCLKGSRITGCLAKEADFREADLSGSDFTRTDLSGSLFGKTDLSGADLAKARNYAIRLPDNRVKDARFSMPEAMSLLYCLDIKIV